MALTVTLLGGESSGKTTLAQALRQRLNDHLCIPTMLVPEHLRDWCATRGRAPLAHEQAERAQAQSHAIATAADTPGTRVVITDTTAMVIAAYSELYFQDRSLWPAAVEQQRGYSLTLLMGLDLPWEPDGLFRDGPELRQATDALLRRELLLAGVAFQTLYGPLESRVRQALRTIGLALGQSLQDLDPTWAQGRRPWNCDKCSDPDCEHKLFTQLLQQRSTKA